MCKVVWFLCLRCKLRAAIDVQVCEGIWSGCESLVEERNFMTSCENCEDENDDVSKVRLSRHFENAIDFGLAKCFCT